MWHAWPEKHANDMWKMSWWGAPWPVCVASGPYSLSQCTVTEATHAKDERDSSPPTPHPPALTVSWLEGSVMLRSDPRASVIFRMGGGSVFLLLVLLAWRVLFPAAPPPTEMRQVTGLSGEFRHGRLHGDASPLTPCWAHKHPHVVSRLHLLSVV